MIFAKFMPLPFQVCNIICNGPKQYEAHKKGLSHLDAVRESVKIKKVKVATPEPVPPAEEIVEDISVDTSTEDNGHLLCNSLGCKEKFKELQDLVNHAKELHGYLISCTGCINMKWKPKEALTCDELIQHYEADHKQQIKEYDLKFFGKVTNWKQGYIKCKLCPDPELGKTGFWLTNEMDKGKIRQHFKVYL